MFVLWSLQDLNLRPADYESAALTNWAKGPYKNKDAELFLPSAVSDFQECYIPTATWWPAFQDCAAQAGLLLTLGRCSSNATSGIHSMSPFLQWPHLLHLYVNKTTQTVMISKITRIAITMFPPRPKEGILPRQFIVIDRFSAFGYHHCVHDAVWHATLCCHNQLSFLSC